MRTWLLALWLTSVLTAPVVSYGEEPPEFYILSTQVQMFAAKNGVWERLGTPNVGLYINTLTGIEIIARLRAEHARRSTGTGDEDYQAAAWILCLLPWTPPKAQQEQDRMKQIRPTLVQGLFVSEARRQAFVRRVNLSRLVLTGQQLAREGISPSGIMDLQGVQ